MKIAVYATDHGFGHLSRQLGWIERVSWNNNDEIHIINDKASKIIDSNMVPNIRVHRRTTDVGPVFDNQTMEVDIKRTKEELDKWNISIETIVQREKDWLGKKNVDLVISDISPVPIESSHQLGIPSLALSSFSWHWVYNDIIPDHPINDRILEMYRKASEAYVLPLTEKMKIFPRRKEISLISRISNERKEISSDKIKIFISMGYSIFPDIGSFLKDPSFCYIVPDHIETENDEVFRIPRKEKNITPYLRASDIALMKTGYSSISEAIALKKPVIAVKRKMIEDEFTGNTIEKLGVGASMYIEDLANYPISGFDYRAHTNAYDNLPTMYQNEGWKSVIEWINDQVS